MLRYIQEHYYYIISPNRYGGVDLLRAIAVLSVVFFHFNGMFTLSTIRIGWIGVDLFFALSGFLIGGMIIDEYEKKNSFSFINFYKHRWLRIYPTYIFGTILTGLGYVLVLKIIKFNLLVAVKQLLINAFFLQTYFSLLSPANYIMYYSHGLSWTLVIEEFFYLFCPLLLVFIMTVSKNNKNNQLVILIILFASNVFVRMYVTRNFMPDNYISFWGQFVLPHSRYDELLAGVISAVIIRKYSINKNVRFILLASGLTILCLFIGYIYWKPVLLFFPYKMTYETLYFPIVFSLMFNCILLSIYNIKMNCPFIIIIARLSYSIYLMHSVAFIYFHKLQINPMFFMGILLSYLVSLFIEYPFLRIYKRHKLSLSTQAGITLN